MTSRHNKIMKLSLVGAFYRKTADGSVQQVQ